MFTSFALVPSRVSIVSSVTSSVLTVKISPVFFSQSDDISRQRINTKSRAASQTAGCAAFDAACDYHLFGYHIGTYQRGITASSIASIAAFHRDLISTLTTDSVRSSMAPPPVPPSPPWTSIPSAYVSMEAKENKLVKVSKTGYQKEKW